MEEKLRQPVVKTSEQVFQDLREKLNEICHGNIEMVNYFLGVICLIATHTDEISKRKASVVPSVTTDSSVKVVFHFNETSEKDIEMILQRPQRK